MKLLIVRDVLVFRMGVASVYSVLSCYCSPFSIGLIILYFEYLNYVWRGSVHARSLFVVNGDRLVRYLLYNIAFIRTWNVFIVLKLSEEKNKPTINQVGFPANTICQNLNFSYVIMASTGASIILNTMYGTAYQINRVFFWELNAPT